LIDDVRVGWSNVQLNSPGRSLGEAETKKRIWSAPSSRRFKAAATDDRTIHAVTPHSFATCR